ncbi:MAG: DUF3394 domain-containing protein, partial [Lautropia sp.]|nr:DUF3394 domain-containing protein [Lautropia sp.]
GIMGDITPPVGLATFAAAAISHESPIRTGLQGASYALRTVILPFIWIFNPQLLLIGIDSWPQAALVFIASTLAMLAFSALTLGWLRTRLRWWEAVLMVLGILILFRPDFLMDKFHPPYEQVPAQQLNQVVERLAPGQNLVVTTTGFTLEGDEKTKTLSLPMGKPAPAIQRLNEAGLGVMAFGDMVQVSLVRFGSPARKIGFEQGWDITQIHVPTGRPSANWFYIPGVLLLALVWFAQGARLKRKTAAVSGEQA